MSIQGIIDRLVTAKILYEVKIKLDDDEGEYRKIYATKAVIDFLEPAVRAKRKVRNGAIDAKRFLKSFVNGTPFDDPERLKNLDTDDLKQHDQGIYAFRIKGHPQRRVFGGFCEDNLFIATHQYDRGDLPDGEWNEEKDDVKKLWSGSFKALLIENGKSVARQLPRISNRSRKDLTSNVRPDQ